MDKIKILLVDDHQIMIDGLLSILRTAPEVEVVATANDGLKALEILKTFQVDLVITDISMPGMDGIQLTKEIKKIPATIQVIALSMFNDAHTVNQMLQAGISGYILKNTGIEEMIAAILKVQQGGIYYTPEISDLILKNINANHTKRALLEKINITDREREIIRLIAKEYSNAAIAAELFISERTVETHRKNIYRKTHSNNVVGMLKFAYEHELLS